MRKAWKIFWFEYRLRVWNWRFLVGLLSGPVLIVLLIVFAGAQLNEMASDASNAMGVVDRSGLIAAAETVLDQKLIELPLSVYPDEQTARKAVDDGAILGYYVLENNFGQNGAARVVLNRQGGVVSKKQFENVVRVALLVNAGYDPQVIWRVVEGAALDYQRLETGVENPAKEDAEQTNTQLVQKLVGMVAVYFLQMFFFMGLNMVSGYVVRIMLEERENRTLEILATSVNPGSLLRTKVFANVTVGLTQVGSWVFLGVAAISLLDGSTRFFGTVDVLRVGLAAVYLMLGIILAASLNSIISSLVSRSQVASMLTGLVTLPIMIPFLVNQAIADQPSSTVAVVLSMIPITAILTMPARLFFALPVWWELAISISLLAAAALLALRLAGWAFHRSIRSGGINVPRFRSRWKRRARGGSHAQ